MKTRRDRILPGEDSLRLAGGTDAESLPLAGCGPASLHSCVCGEENNFGAGRGHHADIL